MSILSRNIRRLAKPSGKKTEGNSPDELIKISDSDIYAGYLEDKLVDLREFPTVIIDQLMNDDGSQQLLLSSDAYFPKMLFVDFKQGNDRVARRESLNRRYRLLNTALTASQDGDTIVIIGDNFSTSLTMDGKRNVNIVLAGGTLTMIDAVGFLIRDASVSFYGFGRILSTASKIFAAFQVNSGGRLSINGKIDIVAEADNTYLAAITDSELEINLHGGNISTGNGVRLFSNSKGIISNVNWELAENSEGTSNVIESMLSIQDSTISHLNTRSSFSSNISIGAGEVSIRNCIWNNSRSFCRFTRFNGNESGKLDIINSSILSENSNASAHTIWSSADAIVHVSIKDSEIKTVEGNTIKMAGNMAVSKSEIVTGNAVAIDFNKTVHSPASSIFYSKIIGQIGYQTSDSNQSFYITHNITNADLPADVSIVEGFNLVDGGLV